MGLNYFIFNGESSLDHGAYVGGQSTYNAPQRDITKIVIPGRNGDLIKDNGRWLNISVPYNIVIMNDFRDRTDEIRAWLEEPKDYVRLEDTYHPDYFRMARFVGPIEFETSAFNRTGKAVITFDCKPERFLKSGEGLKSVTNGGFVLNPTRYESKPLIRITCTGSGTVTIGDYTITVTNIPTYVDVDCNSQNCFAGLLSLNNSVTLSNDFPVLKSGKTSIGWTGNVTAVMIEERWYTV